MVAIAQCVNVSRVLVGDDSSTQVTVDFEDDVIAQGVRGTPSGVFTYSGYGVTSAALDATDSFKVKFTFSSPPSSSTLVIVAAVLKIPPS